MAAASGVRGRFEVLVSGAAPVPGLYCFMVLPVMVTEHWASGQMACGVDPMGTHNGRAAGQFGEG